MKASSEEQALALLLGFSAEHNENWWMNSDNWAIYYSAHTKNWRSGYWHKPAAGDATFPTFKAALEAYAATTGQADVQETLS